MDKKGVISLEAIFSIFIILLIVASILFMYSQIWNQIKISNQVSATG